MNDTKQLESLLLSHYGRANLSDDLFAALQKAGRKITTYRDTGAFDEFHIRGAEATRELANLVGLSQGQKVLDLGCGLGGPSRFIAGEYGCDVTGIDLIPEFIQIASAIAEKVGLTDKVRFQLCNILDLPFKADAFDMVWSQHTLMNISNKAKLFNQIHRVLKPNGILALYEVLAGDLAPIYYPVQWSSDPGTNFLIQENQMRELLHQAGFKNIAWQENSAQCLAWFESLNKKMTSRPQNAPPPVGLNLVIGPTTAEKARNTLRNLQENRIRVIYVVFKKI